MAAQPNSQQYQYVKLPDGSYGKFDAAATDDEIRGHIQQDFPSAFAAPQHVTNTPGASISAAPPRSMWDRARDVVANSAVGRSLEEGLPKVADALNLHPTETVNSPTYQSDRQQVVAPQYLMSANPRGHVQGVAKGALTGAGKLTSGQSLSTMATLAATGGLAAPLAPAATGLRIAGLGYGGYGVGKDAIGAGRSYMSGNTDAGDEQLGELLPNAALMLPSAAKPLESAGEFLQDRGANVMDSYLKAGKNAYRNGAEPGLSVLQQGPGTSVGFTREGFSNGVDAAKRRVGAQIPAIIDRSTAEVPRMAMRSGQDAILRGKTNVLSGPGGDKGNIPAMQDLRDSMAPLVDVPGNASPREVYNAKRNLDENINWGRDIDPKDATANNMRREMRSDVSGHLYDAVPELREPSQQFSGLSAASKLAKNRTFDTNGSVFNPYRVGSALMSGMATEGLSHNPGLSTGVGLATGILPEVAKAPIVKTGTATGLYQLGRGIAATGRSLSRLAPTARAGGDEEAQYPGDTQASQPAQSSDRQFTQSTPPSTYRMSNLTPEIIRPDAISRSRFGLGMSGKGGVMVRPIAGLPAPESPTPQATPYEFTPRPTMAVPSRSSESLSREVGSRASVVPDRLLNDVTSAGSESEKAAALRRSRTGLYGTLAPSRLFSEPEVIPPNQGNSAPSRSEQAHMHGSPADSLPLRRRSLKGLK